MSTKLKQILLIIVLFGIAAFPWVAPAAFIKFGNLLGWLEVLALFGAPILILAALVWGIVALVSSIAKAKKVSRLPQ